MVMTKITSGGEAEGILQKIRHYDIAPGGEAAIVFDGLDPAFGGDYIIRVDGGDAVAGTVSLLLGLDVAPTPAEWNYFNNWVGYGVGGNSAFIITPGGSIAEINLCRVATGRYFAYSEGAWYQGPGVWPDGPRPGVLETVDAGLSPATSIILSASAGVIPEGTRFCLYTRE